MPNIRDISTGTTILLVSGALLLIDTFFAWQSIDLGFAEVSQNAWNGFLGVMLGLLTIALLAWVALQIAEVKLPFELPAPEGLITLALGALVFAFALLKNLVDDYSAWASYVGVALAAGVAIGAWLRRQEAERAVPAAGPGGSRQSETGSTTSDVSTGSTSSDVSTPTTTGGGVSTTPGTTYGTPPGSSPGTPPDTTDYGSTTDPTTPPSREP